MDPSVERGGRRARIERGRTDLMPTLRSVMPVVEENISDAISSLRGRLDDDEVISVLEHAPATSEKRVELVRHADLQSFDAGSDCSVVGRLAEQMRRGSTESCNG